jgi:hypothetical protein
MAAPEKTMKNVAKKKNSITDEIDGLKELLDVIRSETKASLILRNAVLICENFNN